MTRHIILVIVIGSLWITRGTAFTVVQQPQQGRRSASLAFAPNTLRHQCRSRSENSRLTVLLLESKKDDSYVEADDIDAIQQLFNKYCDKDGLMTMKALASMPPFSDMLVRCTAGLKTVLILLDQ